MLSLNGSMKLIRCRKHEYLAKVGTISNYSFDLVDEDKAGVLEYLLEVACYPVSRERLEEDLASRFGTCDDGKTKAILDQLVELAVLVETDARQDAATVFMLAHTTLAEVALERFRAQGYSPAALVFGGESDDLALQDTEEGDAALAAAFEGCEYVVLLTVEFSPSLFYRLNRLCLERGRKLLISYLDGNEGVIIPLLSPSQVGCYNDFEMLRESSLYNLLDYQMMKEGLIDGSLGHSEPNGLHVSALIDQTLLLLAHYSKYTSVNYYAYSIDFERLITTKTRLLRFPRCPSCQGDRNLVHPFI